MRKIKIGFTIDLDYTNLMIDKKHIFLFTLITSLLFQGLSIFQYSMVPSEIYVINWAKQYSIMVLLSMIITVLIYLSPKKNRILYLLIIRYIMIIIIHFPSEIYLGLKLLFLLAFLLDLNFFIPIRYSISSSMGSLFFLLLINVMSLINLGKWNSITIHNTIFSSVLVLIMTGIFIIFRYIFSRMEIEKSKVRQLNQTIANLTDTNYGYQHYVKVVEEKSTEDERNRIIREIHDSIGYTLTTIMMISRSILDMNKGKLGIISENLEEIHSGARDGLKDMRIVLRILKIKKEEHLSHFMELRRMIKAFEKASNLKIRLEWGNTPDNFGEEASHIIFRIIQEGMVNALRHGIASEIDIFLFVGSGKLMITINDNGKGFNKKDPGLGISGMRERIKKFNGTMTLSNSKIGAKVSIELPIEKVLVYGKD